MAPGDYSQSSSANSLVHNDLYKWKIFLSSQWINITATPTLAATTAASLTRWPRLGPRGEARGRP